RSPQARPDPGQPPRQRARARPGRAGRRVAGSRRAGWGPPGGRRPRPGRPRRSPARAVRALRQGRPVTPRRQRPGPRDRRRARRAPGRLAQRTRATGGRARVHAPAPCHGTVTAGCGGRHRAGRRCTADGTRFLRPVMTTQHRHLGVVALLVVATLIAACGPTVGNAGTIPPPPGTPAASVDTGSPDPTAGPSDTPTVAPTASPSGTTIVRAYFLLEDAAGDGPFLVPVLREVPQTKAVARAAMNALLEGPIA